MIEMLIGLFSLAVIVGCSMHIGYAKGTMDGRKDTIHQLFSGEADFKQYLTYRKTGGHDAEVLQKLVNCLRNDYGLDAEWDGLRKVWTIEVDHAQI